jgi:anthranilate synthase component 2
MARVTVIDNYDSFTWNLVHLLGGLGARLTVHRNDQVTPKTVVADEPDAIVLSPGPGMPQNAGICCDLIGAAAQRIPVLGVCLGHQAIGAVFGGRIVRASLPMHGKISQIRHNGTGLFFGINAAFPATRYHSLVVERASLPDDIEVTATSDDGHVMALSHRNLPVHGVQFHPESIASENGAVLVGNFLKLAAAWNQKERRAMTLGAVT